MPSRLEASAEHNPTREITLQLRAGGVPVRGKVLDLSGGEVAGAWVSVSDGLAATTTDDTGMFELWSAPGRRYLSVTADGYVRGAAEISAPTDEAKIYMAPESSVHGKVVDADTGKPLAGVSIRASLETRLWSSALALSYGGSTVTDDAGNFEIDGLTAGRFNLVVDDREAYGQYPGSVGLRLGQATGPIEVRATLRSGTPFSGRLVDVDSGEPVPDCNFELSPAVRGVDPHGWVETDPNGHFEGRFPPGDYQPRIDMSCATHVMQPSTKIAAVRPDSPAAKAGVSAGCTISQMNGRAIQGNATLVHGFLHVPEGTTVFLSCDGAPEVYSVTAGPPR